MRNQSSREFQQANSRRLWTAVGFLVVLVVVALVSASYLIAGMLASGGGTGIIHEIGSSAECGRERLLPLAAAIDRYGRGTGRYPERVEDIVPTYLARQNVLRCPVDKETPPERSSFIYHQPQPGATSPVLLECRHHGSIVVQVQARGKVEPGNTMWVLQMQPLGQEAK